MGTGLAVLCVLGERFARGAVGEGSLSNTEDDGRMMLAMMTEGRFLVVLCKAHAGGPLWGGLRIVAAPQARWHHFVTLSDMEPRAFLCIRSVCAWMCVNVVRARVCIGGCVSVEGGGHCFGCRANTATRPKRGRRSRYWMIRPPSCVCGFSLCPLLRLWVREGSRR